LSAPSHATATNVEKIDKKLKILSFLQFFFSKVVCFVKVIKEKVTIYQSINLLLVESKN
jgi:hypothetical protein